MTSHVEEDKYHDDMVDDEDGDGKIPMTMNMMWMTMKMSMIGESACFPTFSFTVCLSIEGNLAAAYCLKLRDANRVVSVSDAVAMPKLQVRIGGDIASVDILV